MLESFSIGNWGWIIFYLVLTTIFCKRLLIWLLRRHKTGALLLKAETTYGKALRNVGLLTIVVSLLMSADLLSGYHHQTPGKLAENIVRLVFNWLYSLYFVLAGHQCLEFRSQGIYWMLVFTPWHNIKSYSWQQPKKETIRLRLDLRYSFLSIFGVPIEDIEAIEQILHERISSV
jgi:Domain of unknown function (DUF5673)